MERYAGGLLPKAPCSEKLGLAPSAGLGPSVFTGDAQLLPMTPFWACKKT